MKMNWGQSTLPIKILKISGWITFSVKACFPLGFKEKKEKKKKEDDNTKELSFNVRP